MCVCAVYAPNNKGSAGRQRPVDFFFQAEDGIRDLVRSRGLGDVYKRQPLHWFLDYGNVIIQTAAEFGTLIFYSVPTPAAVALSLIHI